MISSESILGTILGCGQKRARSAKFSLVRKHKAETFRPRLDYLALHPLLISRYRKVARSIVIEFVFGSNAGDITLVLSSKPVFDTEAQSSRSSVSSGSQTNETKVELEP